ncbi:MAG: bifunctional molybdenum cofactor biosynthesis protein MoaC/MoaB [Candidatus Nitrosothermus koennekii]|nr:MAG: bifunctional molybdenum cofactor biosynthesis protein MoaC/MoaB [Candidatus Nitrosothermus koennekii]
MIDVSDKPDTFREAVAESVVKVSKDTIEIVKRGESPKGDIVDAVKISSTFAAKKTHELIPYCHPIPIDHIGIDVDIQDNSIIIKAIVKSIWKTGVEMEALTAVSIGALTVYDMLKPIDDNISIESIKLIKKRGGLKRFYEKPDKTLKAAVIIVSDTASKDEKADKSGNIIINKLKENYFDVIEYKIIPDEKEIIESLLRKLSDQGVDLIITSGGTGVGPRDVTPEATLNVIEKEMKGIEEALRAYGQRRTPLSMLSRGVVGVRKNSVIVNLPGSPKAVSESLNALFPGVLHIYKMLGGYKH